MVIVQLMLLEPVRFAEEAAGPVAVHCGANLAAGHHTERPRLRGRGQGVENGEPAFIAATMVVHLPELAGALQPLAFRE